MREYNFIEICEKLIEFSTELNKIPSQEQIKNNNALPSSTTLRIIFRENGYSGYREFLEGKGFTVIYKQSPFAHFTYNDLCLLWEKYFEENGKYPVAEDCARDSNLPTWDRLKIICGDKFKEFYSKYGRNHILDKNDYDSYCKRFIDISKEIGRALTSYDLINNTYGLPNGRWFVRYCPDENVNDYNQFINYLGLKPSYKVSKEYTIKAILKKHKEVNRNLKKSDFEFPKDDEIGIATIYNHWGNFNNMLMDLGFEINQEIMKDKTRSIEELKEDIDKLCLYIKETENRDIISREDVNVSERCLTAGTYDRWFKKELNMTLCDYIKSIGFKCNKAGMGMVYEYEDGEIVTSKFEFEVSNYLRDKKVNYNRNILYSDFIDCYEGLKDCDYVINHYNKLYYIEVAGMLDYSKVNKNKDDFIREKYKKDLNDKIHMLDLADLSYLVIYPSDLREKSLDEIFSFLYK